MSIDKEKWANGIFYLITKEIVFIKNNSLILRVSCGDVAPYQQQTCSHIPIGNFKAGCEKEFFDILFASLNREILESPTKKESWGQLCTSGSAFFTLQLRALPT